ncbi:MAG: hypothetical protein IPP81_14640 [Chitinophagaceae bacterium]|nr:hypothetical protein [Chitinophagaceae bacterium]
MSEIIKSNPKALNLEAVKQSHNKVTVGFKCPPAVKLDLAEKAENLGITLSEFVENLIMNSEKLFEKFKMHEKEEKERLTLTIIEQKETIEFYQNDLLRNLFEKSKNQTATYKNEKNETLNLKIVDIKDIFTIITSAYKIENDETDTNAICTI